MNKLEQTVLTQGTVTQKNEGHCMGKEFHFARYEQPLRRIRLFRSLLPSQTAEVAKFLATKT